MSSLKVLLVISETPPVVSGIARSAARLQQGLRLLGHHVDMMSLDDVPRYTRGEIRLSSMLWKGSQVLLPRLKSYDIVNVQGPVPTFSDVALLFGALGRRGGGPLVVYTHHSEIDLPQYRALCDLYNWTHKQIARLADQVFVSTPSYARDLGRYIPAERIAIVPWGIDVAWDDGAFPKDDDLTVLFVGQLRPYKGLDVLLRAVARVPGVNLRVIGGGHHEAEYHALAGALNLERRVTFHGRVPDAELFEAYARSHVIVLPSTTRAEAFGLVVLEGMAAGCVPVVSRLPGVADIPGDAGLTFPVGDATALAAHLARLRDDAALRADLSARARRRARLFSWQRTVYWHHAHYQRLAALQRFGTAWRDQGAEDEALQALLHDTVTTLDASSGSLMLVEPHHQLLHMRAAHGLPDGAWWHGGRPLDHGVAGFVALHSRPLMLPQGLHTLSSALASLTQQPHIHSSLSVPIRGRDHTLGVLNLSSYSDSRTFYDDDLHWLDGLARRAGHILSAQVPAPVVLPGKGRLIQALDAAGAHGLAAVATSVDATCDRDEVEDDVARVGA